MLCVSLGTIKMILAALQRLHRQKLFLLIDHNFQFLETRFYSATPVPNDEVVRQSRTVARNEQLLQQRLMGCFMQNLASFIESTDYKVPDGSRLDVCFEVKVV